MNNITSIFFKMDWLSQGITAMMNFFSLNTKTTLGKSIHFFLFDTIKIFILLSVLVFLMGIVQSYFTKERAKHILESFRGLTSRILSALLGTVTPFCSCSSIPLFIGFTSAGIPLGTTFSFLISSPMVDLASMILLSSFFGYKMAFFYMIIGLALAVIGGTVIDRAKMEDQVQSYIYQTKGNNDIVATFTCKQRLRFAIEQVKEIILRVYPYVIIGVALGAIIHNWIPESWIQSLLGKNNPFSLPLAVIIGIPMYADIFGVLPIAEALITKGVPIGTVVAFMMSVTILSLPSLIMLKKVIKNKLLFLFLGICTIGILLIGLIFNIVFA